MAGVQASDVISKEQGLAILRERRNPQPTAPDPSQAASVLGKLGAQRRAEAREAQAQQQQAPIKDRPAFQPQETEVEDDPGNQVQAGAEDVADELPEGQEPQVDQTGDEPTIEIDGQVLSAQEIRDSYLRQADYTRKTQEVSDKARILAEKESVLNQRESQGFTKLNDLIATLERSVGQKPDWAALAQSGQYDANQLMAYRFQYESQMEAIQAAKQQATQLEQENLQRAKGSMYQELITTYKPEWRDSSKLQSDIGSIANYAISEGITQQELAYISRAPVFKMLHKAFLYDEAQKAKSVVQNKVRTLPKPLKPGTVRGRTDQAAAELQQARKTWDSSSHTVKDGLKWLNAKKAYETSTGRKAH